MRFASVAIIACSFAGPNVIQTMRRVASSPLFKMSTKETGFPCGRQVFHGMPDMYSATTRTVNLLLLSALPTTFAGSRKPRTNQEGKKRAADNSPAAAPNDETDNSPTQPAVPLPAALPQAGETVTGGAPTNATPEPTDANLDAHDTETAETKKVATLAPSDKDTDKPTPDQPQVPQRVNGVARVQYELPRN